MSSRTIITVLTFFVFLCAAKEFEVQFGSGLILYTNEETASKMKAVLSRPAKTDFTTPYPYTKNGETPSYVECKKNLMNQCERGSVKISPWYKRAIRFQLEIQMNQSLSRMQIPSTHNSHISYADGVDAWQRELTHFVQGWDASQRVHLTNQWITVTDQLELGIRGIELDIHYVNGLIRICHAGGTKVQFIDDLVERIGRFFNTTIRWNSRTLGCFDPVGPTFDRALEELSDWLKKPENAREVIVIYLDNQPHLQTWGQVLFIHKSILSKFESTIFTPQMKRDRFPNRWPSGNELLSMGKKILFVSRQDFGAELEPTMFSRPLLLQDQGMDSFRAFPQCAPAHQQPITQMNRIVSYGLWYAWFKKDDSYVDAAMMEKVMECDNVNIIALEMITPRLMESIIWSWEKNEPSRSGCVVLDDKTKKWKVMDCTQKLPIACVSVSNSSVWTLGPESDFESARCPEGLKFGFPLNGKMNRLLKDHMKNSPVWLNLKT
jgi:hypothetical protein